MGNRRLLLGCVRGILIGGWYDVELTPIPTQLSCGGARNEVVQRVPSRCPALAQGLSSPTPPYDLESRKPFWFDDDDRSLLSVSL